MKLPIVQYKTYRVAYTVAACFGLVPLCIGVYGLVKTIGITKASQKCETFCISVPGMAIKD